jgi:hypothetical protein
MNRSRKVVVGITLISAPGSAEMQQALASPHVHAIVDGMLYANDSLAFRRIAQFLRENRQKTDPRFAGKFAALRINLSARPGKQGERTLSPLFATMMTAIDALYDAEQTMVDYQRGAIVELLAGELVQGHCQVHEFFSNHKFVDGRYSTNQIDLIVHIPLSKQCEAYSCKIHPYGIKSADCTDLSKLVDHLDTYQYDTHIGTICFENSKQVEGRICEMVEGLGLKTLPKAYGLDNFFDLEKDPFAS